MEAAAGAFGQWRRLVSALVGPGPLSDGEIRLVLANVTKAQPEKGYLPAYVFQIRRCQDDVVAGSCTLRVGENEAVQYSGHIGYAVHPDWRGRRYAARAVALLLPLAFRNKMKRVLVTCLPENQASRRTCLRAGGVFLGIAPVPGWHEMYRTGRKAVCRYLFCPAPQ